MKWLSRNFSLSGSGRLVLAMPEVTAQEAFALSIEKWRRIVKLGKEVKEEGGRTTCALCRLFYSSECEGCPIREYTNCLFCLFTPYTEMAATWAPLRCHTNTYSGDDFPGPTIAHAEVQFLEMLYEKLYGELPEETEI